MRIVFMGTPDFAVPVLQAVAAEHEVVGVYTRPDAKSGRGSKLRPSPVKVAALELGLPVFTPHSFREEGSVEELAALAPDAVVTAAYGVILPRAVLDIPRLGCLNVHGSLLPRWRGAAPMQRAILAEDDETGICIMRMEEGLDTGDVCCRRSVPLVGKNLEQLTRELSQLGADVINNVLDSLEQGTVIWEPQSSEGVTYAEKIAKTELRLDPSASAHANLLRVLASSDAAPARAAVCGKGVAVLAAHEVPGSGEAGAVTLGKHSVTLETVQGGLVLDEVKPDGKKAMQAAAWRAGLNNVEQVWGQR